MGDVVKATFGQHLSPLRDMPRSAPEILNQLSVFAHDRNDIIKHLSVAERQVLESTKNYDKWREALAGIDAKIAALQKDLINDIIREVVPGRTQ
jgi:hypothetical protein